MCIYNLIDDVTWEHNGWDGGGGVLCWISFPDAACTTASSRYLMAGFRLCMRTGSQPLPVTPPPCLVVLDLIEYS